MASVTDRHGETRVRTTPPLLTRGATSSPLRTARAVREVAVVWPTSGGPVVARIARHTSTVTRLGSGADGNVNGPSGEGMGPRLRSLGPT